METPPPIDASVYEWTELAPLHWQRPALSSEALWPPRPKEHHELFIGGSLILETPIPSSAASAAAEGAWRRLRFEVPELAVSAGYGSRGQAYMQYQVPSGNEVDEWVARTTDFACTDGKLDFGELLELARLKRVEGGVRDQVFLVMRCREEGLVERVYFMLNADHQITDGIGIKILLGRFLELLASCFSSSRQRDQGILLWEESPKNLSPAWVGIMNEQQLTSGLEYEKVAKLHRDILYQKMPQNPGLPLLSGSTQPTQKIAFITLTEEQSLQLLSVVKQSISPNSNITHLAHAAMVLALLRAYSPSRQPETLYSPCWLNGRKYLRHKPGQPDPKTTYLPICQSFAPVIFSNLGGLALSQQASREEVRDKLIEACKSATAEYGKIRERKSVLPECILLFEEMGRNMHQEYNILPSKSPPPLSSNDIESKGEFNYSEEVQPSTKTADPFFLSDGITENYISHSYFDKPTSAATEREKVFEVDEINFAANAEKNLIVRMSSWRGKITISGEWKESDYDNDLVTKFLEDLVRIMLSLVGGD